MLDRKGFKRKRYNEIIESMNERARELFGDDINLGSRSPLGMFLRVVAWFISQLWELAEKVYFSGFASTAEGNNLDLVARNNGLVRIEAKKSSGKVFIDGTGTINAGFKVSDGEITFETTEGGSLPGEFPIIALERGTDGNVPANTITEIVNPQVGAETVNNPEPTTGGRGAETDAEFRSRYFLSFAVAGASTLDSIIASLLRTEGVRSANVENVLDGDDIIGIRPIVLGGENDDIAKTLLEYKAWGVKTFGGESGEATAINNETYTLNFDYATVIDVYANINIKVSDEFPLNGEELIIETLLEYLGGLDEDGTLFTGTTMGEDVIYSRLIKRCFKVDGVDDVDIEISIDNITFNKENVEIGSDEVAESSFDKLVITVE